MKARAHGYESTASPHRGSPKQTEQMTEKNLGFPLPVKFFRPGQAKEGGGVAGGPTTWQPHSGGPEGLGCLRRPHFALRPRRLTSARIRLFKALQLGTPSDPYYPPEPDWSPTGLWKSLSFQLQIFSFTHLVFPHVVDGSCWAFSGLAVTSKVDLLIYPCLRARGDARRQPTRPIGSSRDKGPSDS